MKRDDIVSSAVLEAHGRLAKIIPVAQTACAEEGIPLSELQLIALGTVILQVFDGFSETLGRLFDAHEVLEAFRAPRLGDEVERWLAERDDETLH